MNEYQENGLTESEKQKNQNKRNAANNAQALRIAANVASKSGDPYVGTAAKVIVAADKLTGGKSSELVGQAVNLVTKNPLMKPVQGVINKGVESGAADVAGKVASAKMAGSDKKSNNTKTNNQSSTDKNTKSNDDVTANTSLSKKNDASSETKEKKNRVPIITIIIGIIFVPILILIMIVIISLLTITSLAAIPNEKINECRRITVVDSENNIYDGEVNFEDYIAGVLAAKKLETDNVEYYKAIAIETRTKVLNTLSSSCQLEGNEEFLPYIDVEESIYKSIITEAVNETSGIVITSSDLIYIINEDKINYEESIKLINEENYTYKDIINKYYGKENEEISLTDANRINISKTVEGFINPLTTGHCTSPFGYRDLDGDGYNEGHTGLDIGGNAAGTPIYATKNGTIVAVVKHVPGFSTVESCGNYVTIDHGDGTKTSYCHMLYGSIPTWVVSGTAVEQGEKIGEVGNTGHSYGAHLHYMVRLNGELQDPVDYVDTSVFGGTCKQ